MSLSENKVVIKSKSCREGLNIFLSADYLADDQPDWRLASLVPLRRLFFMLKFSRVEFLVVSPHRTAWAGRVVGDAGANRCWCQAWGVS